MSLLELEEIPKIITSLQKQIDSLEHALLLSGVCPRCGNKIEPKPLDNIRLKEKVHHFTCACGLDYILSNKAIDNIKHGKDITAP